MMPGLSRTEQVGWSGPRRTGLQRDLEAFQEQQQLEAAEWEKSRFIELRHGQEWCTLCRCWSGSGHMGGRKHQINKQALADQ